MNLKSINCKIKLLQSDNRKVLKNMIEISFSYDAKVYIK